MPLDSLPLSLSLLPSSQGFIERGQLEDLSRIYQLLSRPAALGEIIEKFKTLATEDGLARVEAVKTSAGGLVRDDKQQLFFPCLLQLPCDSCA